MTFDNNQKVTLPKSLPKELFFPEINTLLHLNRSLVKIYPIGQQKVPVTGGTYQMRFKLPVENVLMDPSSIRLTGNVRLDTAAGIGVGGTEFYTFFNNLGAYGLINRITLQGSNSEVVHEYNDYRTFMEFFNSTRELHEIDDCLYAGIAPHQARSGVVGRHRSNHDRRNVRSEGPAGVFQHNQDVHTMAIVDALKETSHGFDFRMKLHGLNEFAGSIGHLLPLSLLGDMAIVIEWASPESAFTTVQTDAAAGASAANTPFTGTYHLDNLRLEYDTVQTGDEVMMKMASMLTNDQQFASMALVMRHHTTTVTTASNVSQNNLLTISIPLSISSAKAVFLTFTPTSPGDRSSTSCGRSPYGMWELGADTNADLANGGGISSAQITMNSAVTTPVQKTSTRKEMLELFRRALKVCGMKCNVTSTGLVTATEATDPKGDTLSVVKDLSTTTPPYNRAWKHYETGDWCGGLNKILSHQSGGGQFIMGFPLTGSSHNAGDTTMDGVMIDNNMIISLEYATTANTVNKNYRVNAFVACSQLTSIMRAGVTSVRQ